MLRLVRYSRWASPLELLNSQTKLLLPAFYASTTTDEPSRPSPPPIQVSLTESAGRGVFATRRIGAGELIHTAKPVVSHPSLSATTSVCYLCLRNLGSRQKSEAPGVPFCSEECKAQSKELQLSLGPAFAKDTMLQPNISQDGFLTSDFQSQHDFYEVEKRADWTFFNDYCRTQGLKYPLLAKRLACMVISGAATAESLDILHPTILFPEMILQMEKEFLLLRSAFEEAQITDEQIAFITKQWYIGVLARIRINAFRIELAGGLHEDLLSLAAASVEAEAAVGNAVYMLPSFYNHDCDPNTHIVWIEDVDARVKALRDIEAGEELRICYIDASMDHGARQMLLYEGFGFRCSCPRCSSGD